MGGPRNSVQVLLLSVVGAVCLSTFVSANSNITLAPESPISENSKTNISIGSQDNCRAVNLQNASHRISAAVDTLAAELSCKRGENGTLSEDKSKELEQNLRQIVELTAKVFFDLGTNESGLRVLDTFGVLDSLNLGNHSDSRFIRLWFSLKMAPLLSHVDEKFLIQLSNQNFSCSSFQELIEAMNDEELASQEMKRKLIYTHFIQVYLSRTTLQEPGCTKDVSGSAEWLRRNLGKFSIFASLEDLRRMNTNFSAREVVQQLTPNQKAELILDPESGALENEAIVREVLTSLIESPDGDQLNQFSQALTHISTQKNITHIINPAVRDTILNLTLTALAPEFGAFEPKDYKLWFQVNLATVLASLSPGSLVVIPSNISCASYAAILTGLQQSLTSLPLDLSQGVRSSVKSLKERFPRCSLADSFLCKQTPVDEDLICASVNGSQLEQTLATSSSSGALCNFTITAHACSLAKNLTRNNLVTLMKCSLESQTTYPVAVWKLFFQKTTPAMDEALDSLATMYPNSSFPSSSHALEALGEVRIANFSQAQLQNNTFVSSWFQTKMRPFSASPSLNFLSCLGSRNFSCQTYQTVIQTFSSQRPSMDREKAQAVYTHFIKPFLSRNDSSDPGCVSSSTDSIEWLQANLGDFSAFATLQDLQVLNPNFSSAESLSVLTPAQVAQLTLSAPDSNDTDQIDRVFERLQQGNALENVDEFLTELAASEQEPKFQPVVRDRVMNRTFAIISPHFPQFKSDDWLDWFHGKLVLFLPSFSAVMLKTATSNINCTNYHVVVSGMGNVFPAIPLLEQRAITVALLSYLRESDSAINEPDCRQGIESDAQWLESNLGPFSTHATYSDLKVFNLSGVAVVDSLSANQKAELILDPESGALENETIVRYVLTSLTASPHGHQLNQFFQAFTDISKQKNITHIINPAVRDTILNLTLTALAPEFGTFKPKDYKLWFQVNLATVLASLSPGSLVVIPSNISCASYAAILTGLQQSLTSLPLDLSQGVRSSVTSLKERFPRCSLADSFLCKQTPVDEDLICASVNGSQLEQTLATSSSSGALCNFTITAHACSLAKNLTRNNLVTLMKCSLESQTTYPVAVWKLFFQKTTPAMDEALDSLATMYPNSSFPSSSHALEALGEVRIANFSQAQLQNNTFVSSWFQTKMRPFSASPSLNFLSCLGSRNFSCQTYQTVIQTFSSQRPSMDREKAQAVYTHFIKPFLSRNDSSDPGCVSSSTDSIEWLQANLGDFSAFATLQDLQVLNPNFSSAESLSVLTPAQVAQLTLSAPDSNDTDQIDRVFERLQQGNALENVDEFLTELAASEQEPKFQPVVRDRVMNRTFAIISPHFPQFKSDDWLDWFHGKLVLFLPSFSAVMLKTATSNINCTNYHVVVSGMGNVFPAIPLLEQRAITVALLSYLRESDSAINEPDCRQGIESDAQWLESNLGPFSTHATYSDLKVFNLSGVAVVDSLSANQKAELILDPESGALENETIVRHVLTSLTASPHGHQLNQFFQAFTDISKQKNITHIINPAVRDTILNLTLTALAPEFGTFKPKDYKLWFQVNLATVLASLSPGSLVVIPSNISCASYAAILTGLQQSLTSLPLDLSQGVRSSVTSLKERFPRCSLADSFLCKQTPVDEDLICASVNGSQLEQTLATSSSSGALCNFTITAHACSLAKNLTRNNLVTLMKCSLESQTTYPVAVWKLFFQKTTPAMDEALDSLATMYPNSSFPSSSHALEALGEVRIANFSQAQLQNNTFVSSWFQTKMRPFSASPSLNFLSCLGSRNFSCQTYQTVIQTFSSQRPSMDREKAQAVYTHFIKPFLSRNDSSDPGCVSSSTDSIEWLQANLGDFSAFATLQDLQVLNPNFSSAESLSVLTPAQVAQLTLSAPDSNDTDQIDRVFERLQQGNALENVDEFLTELAASEQEPKFQPVVRDRVMNRTFAIISPHFPQFKSDDWLDWFHGKLVLFLPSFSAVMLKTATSNINCTNYHVVVSGMGNVFPAIPLLEQRAITVALLSYLRESDSAINEPDCRQGIESDAQWLESNLGPFSTHATYSDLKVFNLSGVAVVDSLSANQKAELILDPESGALENETIVRHVLTSLTASPHGHQLNQFFQAFTDISKQKNITHIINPAVRDTILNLTLTALAPEFGTFKPKDYKLWFQVNLATVLASLSPGSLVVIPSNISCASYAAILTGLQQSLTSLPLDLSQGVRSSVTSLKERFPRCSLADSFLCKQTPVDEDLICASVNGSQLEQTLATSSSSGALCNFTITAHACSLAKNLTRNNLVTLMKCSLESQTTYPVAVWKLFFQKTTPAMDEALDSLATMYPNSSFPSSSHALEALGEVRIANFSQAQLQNNTFVSSWFQTKMRPFSASPSLNFLSCLGSRNFSCQTYQTVIQTFSSQRPSMDREKAQAVYTHFIKPFLSRNDSSDPGCVSSSTDSIEWLQANLGDFSAFATLQDLQVLNPNFSSAESLSVLTPAQVAQLTLSAPDSNDTDQIDRVFERLQQGNALENVDEFLTELAASEQEPKFQPVVRDRVMNRTFAIISPHFPQFKSDDWLDWFHGKLVLFLPSFSAVMLKTATSNINCTNYHVVVSGMGNVFPAIPLLEQRAITVALLSYLRESDSAINEPDCRQGIESDAQWLESNLGPFSTHATYSDLKVFNLSGVAVVDSLSANQKAELILDPESGALENETIVRHVLTSLTASPHGHQLNQFFQAFTDISKQKNITHIINPAVRDTILNLTLTALAPEFGTFKPKDYKLWFQVNLATVLASLSPGSLVVIPSNISCASYAAILTGLQQSLTSLPLDLSQGVRSSVTSLKERFPRCSLADSFLCKQTPVDEDLICASVNGSQLEQTLATSSSSGALCNFTITAHACSLAKNLTRNNLVTLMKCSLESQTTYPVAVWKLFFQKTTPAMDEALDSLATMYPNSSFPSSSHALEALGEVRIANFSQAQLQNNTFVSSWFQTKMRPFSASPSLNFLSCLGSRNFSCQTYQTVIQTFSSQRPSMDREKAQAVYTHFIKPFLSRNDSSDPGCVSSSTDSIEWLQANLGDFSAFATLQDLQVLNPNFSSAESLSVLTPAQVAQLTLSAPDSNDTDQIDRVFERLQQGNALENVDEFLTELAASEQEPKFQPVVRDRVMNRTFAIISPHFPQFKSDDWLDWFHGKLVLFLPSFSAVMLKTATSNINCTNYHVVVSGMGNVFPAIPLLEQRAITVALLSYLRESDSAINEPDCRQGIESDAQWLESNLGPFSTHATYSDLKVFNLSGVAVVDSLSANQKAELILDPESGALENETIVRHVLTSLTASPHGHQLNQFFQAFTDISKQKNITHIINPAVRDTILNLTLTALAPEFGTFKPKDYKLWFQVNLATVLASLSPGSLVVIPSNISCASYAAILTGLQQSLTSLPLDLSQGVRSSVTSLKERFPRCSLADSFLCKQTPVDEDLICASVNGSQLEQTLATSSSSGALCNFTITAHACSLAKNLTRNNLVTLMKCSLESQTTYPVAVWKLFFQKTTPAMDEALDSLATMYPNSSFPSSSHALEALGEVRIANFSQAQLQNNTFVSSWFQTKMRPFSASPSLNFLSCLGSRNFSCQTYQTVIQTFSSQRPSMDREKAQAVYTHFIKPFLSRNDSSDPGCVSSSTDSIEWLQANLGDFSAFATLQDLQVLNPNFSSAESLSVLTPAQVAQLTLSAPDSNDTDQIDRVFERLQQGNALENVDEFLTELAASEQEPKFQPVVRDRVMNRTFAIISPHFPQFKSDDWLDWFHGKLVLFLPSFSAVMLKTATSNINCTNYHVVVSGMGNVFPAIPLLEQRAITVALLSYLRESDSAINEPDCRQGIESDAQWLESNLGPFSTHATYSDLKVFNLSGVAVVDSLSANQKAELILDPESGALENETIVRHVLTSLTASPHGHQLNQFFQAFTDISKQKNITHIINPAVRDTILNLTLTALAPEFGTFKPKDYKLWFQVNLATVLASLSPGSLVVIPSNISCASYAAILTGLQQSLTSLPLDLSQGVRSSVTSLKERFPRCSLADSFLCKQTPVDEDLICASVNGSQLEQTLATSSSSGALCNFTITAHACSLAKNLTRNNLVTLMKCSLESQTTYPVAVWKLFFQKTTPAMDEALDSLATMYPNSSFPSSSHTLEALGEVRIANFSQAQLQNNTFVSSWFQTKMRPFSASPSLNFLSCLGSRNFSCQTYQTVIQTFSSQRPSMDREKAQAVYTHFIKPFLSRNDSSDPGCVSSSTDSIEWLQANLGDFSAFATLQDLQVLNPNFSSAESLSVLTPAQVAQLTLSAPDSNDTDQIDRVFERLQQGNALENVDEFLTELAASEQEPKFQPVVRDRVMNRTFAIISPHFPQFKSDDWLDWFHGKLVLFLPSFSAVMLKTATSNINCTNYHVVVSGMGNVFPAIPLLEQRAITVALLSYLRESDSAINEPDCRQGIESDAQWLESNLGPFSTHATYSDLKVFNLSGVAVVDSLSANQKAELILDPESGALENETIVRYVLTSLTASPHGHQLNQFFQAFTDISKQKNITHIINPAVRDTILNLTLTALAPEFGTFKPKDYKLWFQVNLATVLASLSPGSLVVIPSNISCASYAAILTGLQQSLTSLPLDLSQGVRSSVTSLKERFPRCSLADSFLCKQTPVDEDLICASVNGSQLEQTLATSSSSGALCNFTITAHACSLAKNLTRNNLVTLMKCSLESQTTYPVAVWKLFFQKTTPAMDEALDSLATMYPNSSFPSSSHALEALGEVRIANFSQAQLQNNTFVSSWFQTKMRPFSASPSLNFLSCLGSRNFSCQTYQTVIQTFSSQRPSMDREKAQAVYTHFIKPFLSRNDSSDPGCVSSSTDSIEWLQANLGDFSAFATLQDLQVLNPNFSSAESLSVLTPAQVAQLTLSAPDSNDTDQIDRVFERLQQGNALENVDEFLTELAASEQEPKFQPVVRDRVMNRTFAIISPHFPQFKSDDWLDWFHGKLVLFLPSFSAVMLKTATSNINCTNYHVVVSGMGNVFPAIPLLEQRAITVALLSYLRESDSAINEPDCRQGIESDAQWLESNLGPFSTHATYSDLKVFNLSGVAVVDSLSANQKAELILDPESGALENETIVRHVLTSLTASPHGHQLNQFFQAFTDISKQKNITHIINPAVRDTILNLTLTALAPEFGTFKPKDYKLWFQVNLATVLASLSPGSLVVIPSNISCASYAAILTGLQQSLTSLPLDLSQGVRSSVTSLKERFPRCSLADSFLCKQTPVDEDLICASVNGSQLEQTLATSSSSGALCNFTITAHACSLAKNLTRNNLVTLMKCSLESQTTYPVAVWKLFFQKTTPAMDEALDSLATMYPNSSFPSSSHALEALGEVRIANFSQAQLQNNTFVSSWFQTKMRPFSASPSLNFLSCLGSRNFSCQTYQTVIQTFSSQRPSMDREKAQAVYTHFIKPFLSRNDSSDPGCVSSSTDSIEWLQANLGDFSAFATLQDLQVLNPNFSSAESLSVLTPAQVAQLTLSAPDSNDTDQIDRVFERLQQGNALENVDEFLTELAASEQEPKFQPVVRDRVMNRTFAIISPHFPQFKSDDWLDWFHGKLVLFLPSFSAVMLKTATSNINCTNYHVVVSGMGNVFPAIPLLEQRAITVALLSYLRESDSAINEPDCRQGIESDAQWLESNLGPFSTHATYSDLKVFNLSGVAVVDSLSANQKAELILDPESGALENETIVRHVLTSLTASPHGHQLNQFFQAFTDISKQKNITHIINPAVRDTILNLTLTALAPEFGTFKPKDYKLWFQVNLATVLASLSPGSLVVIPSNISCASYAAILTGLQQSLTSLPLDLSQGVRSSVTSLKERFPRCSLADSFLCKQTPVDEDLICASVNGSQLEQTLATSSSSGALCNFTITAHACSLAKNLTRNNLVTLMKCSLESQTTYPVAVWKLFFQKTTPAMDEALDSLATMYPNSSFPSSSHALEALGEVRIANFSQAQLQNNTFVSSWFQTKMRPFSASPSLNFLSCLGSRNFSCQTYQTVIQTFSSQRPSMDREKAQAVYTHFIKPFLSRNDSSDPGCVSSSTDSIEWLQANLGDFSAFATLQDLQVLNPNFSSAESLSVLTPAQVAQLTLSAPDSNDTDQIDRVFERLQQGNALENVDEFLTELAASEQEPKFQPVVRDRVMNRTFAIISPHFPQFKSDDWLDWFHGKLVLFLPSFSAVMLKTATSNINCTNYHVVVSGMGNVFPAIPLLEQRAITVALLSYLRESDSAINEPDCRQGIESDAQWLESNLGPFSTHATYSDLKVFNLSGENVLQSLSSRQKAELLLEPNNLSNETLVRLVFTELTMSSRADDLGSFFDTFVSDAAKKNLTSIEPRVRDTILNLTLSALGPELSTFDAVGFKLWFQDYLPLFLPSIDSSTFNVIPQNISCDSYQEIVTGCDSVFTVLSERQTKQVFTFAQEYLRKISISGLSCVESGNDDRRWLEDNFGQFRVHASYTDFVTLKNNFDGVEVADLLTVTQLAELAATPPQLQTMQQVTKVMTAINPVDFGAFFDRVSPAIQMHQANYTEEVKSAFLQAVFDRGNLSSSAVSDTEFLLWLRVRLSPPLVNLSPSLVLPLFDIVKNRSCNSSQETMMLLDTLQTTFSNNTQREIFKNTLLFLKSPTPLRCYSGGSFYVYLKNTFLSFGFPDLSMFTSLLPQTRESELLSTISTSELRQFLSQPSVIDNSSDICVIFNNYNNTPAFLETEDVPDNVKKDILPCVWSLALGSDRRSEVNSWFDLRLRNYLRFLSKSLISSTKVQNASCLAFQKLVSVMGNNFTYNTSEFGRADVYTTIRSYLRIGSGARCYNASDAEQKSTSWFVNYIGSFVTFITLDDLTSFISPSQAQVFSVDQANLELFNNTAIPENVTNYYISQLFAFNQTFSPAKLPGFFLCSPEIPSAAYMSVNEAETTLLLNEIKKFCNGTVDQEVSAALASNIQTITGETFVTLGSASSGLSNSQITSVPPSVLVSSLSTLGTVSTWSQEQATTIIQIISTSGFQLNTGSSLESLGTLITGVPSKVIDDTPASELLSISQNLAFVSNMLESPSVVQQTFVQKIISVETSPAQMVQNVPDAMATEIPPSLLVFSEENVDISVLNRKKWTPSQAAMFFETLAETNFDSEQLTTSFLQGFTCTSVQRMTTTRIRGLVRACRPRRGRAKVELKESQLTCMYNLLSGNISQNFTDYPSDMLLYFNKKDIKRDNCRAYISAVGAADFAVASSILNKDSLLLSEARTCLGINGLNLSRDNVEVLGNMACTLNSSYIQNADPLILEKLKACKDFSGSQVEGMETLLLSGKTPYGNVTTWNQQTLEELGTLPLYLTRNFWGHFKAQTKRRFLKSFMPRLRKSKTKKRKLKKLFKEISSRKTKRGAGCTVGNITQVTVRDASFPFGYDQTQFDLCLDIPVLKDNLNSICDKVDDDDLQKIILKKLNQAFPSSVSDTEVQVLGSVSRVASLDDISKWSIKTVDTLGALMKDEDGSWESAKSNAIITKYLSTSGNTLGSTELNIIDSNMCSLDTSTLKTISPDSIRNAKPLNVVSCSSEQKRILYEISNTSFSSQRARPSTFYNLIKAYIGGAPLPDVKALSTQNINMDVDTFRSLDPNVIADLTVTDVQGLMGNHLQDLKVFENDPVIQSWVNRQVQSDLDTLGLNLTTTNTSPTTTSSSSVGTTTQGNTNSSSANLTTTAPTTNASTTSGGRELAKHPTSIFLAALLTTVLQIQRQLT